MELTFCIEALLAVTRRRLPEIVVEARVAWVKPNKFKIFAVAKVDEVIVELVITADVIVPYEIVEVATVVVLKVNPPVVSEIGIYVDDDAVLVAATPFKYIALNANGAAVICLRGVKVCAPMRTSK